MPCAPNRGDESLHTASLLADLTATRPIKTRAFAEAFIRKDRQAVLVRRSVPELPRVLSITAVRTPFGMFGKNQGHRDTSAVASRQETGGRRRFARASSMRGAARSKRRCRRHFAQPRRSDTGPDRAGNEMRHTPRSACRDLNRGPPRASQPFAVPLTAAGF